MTARADDSIARTLLALGGWMLRIPRGIAWIFPLAWACLIAWLSSQRVHLGLPAVGVVPLLGNLVHAFEYGILAILCLPCLPRKDGWVELQGQAGWMVVLLCMAFALSDEWHQSWVPGRSASLLDAVTDLVGILGSLWIVRLVGQAPATRPSLLRALWFVTLACLVAAGISTAWDTWVGEGPWPFGGGVS
ncbi:MAG: VanZ family protein [Planctomycetes bacterium]|nr:VanZ family protein [Planctomycetota bacterium]MCB9909024.1 VanZ family protein [Planctomycetota bacterium]MCB9911731.1 VanZ family protein [Planctomycetota bacterium]HRV82339.1 VanZ family protein [Planctomycetota bacterium]